MDNRRLPFDRSNYQINSEQRSNAAIQETNQEAWRAITVAVLSTLEQLTSYVAQMWLDRLLTQDLQAIAFDRSRDGKNVFLEHLVPHNRYTSVCDLTKTNDSDVLTVLLCVHRHLLMNVLSTVGDLITTTVK